MTRVSGIHSEGTILPLTGQPMRSVCQMVFSWDSGPFAKISSKKKCASFEPMTRQAASASGELKASSRNSGMVRDI